MSENSTNKPNQSTPSYAIVPFALLKSQLYWFYSAFYSIFRGPKESGPIPKVELKRDRSQSDPVTQETSRKKAPKRRSSAPGVRERPSKHDERTGTTCPPVWWQKTRVKLGHTPVHGDPQSMKESVDAQKHRSKRKLFAKLLHHKQVSL